MIQLSEGLHGAYLRRDLVGAIGPTEVRRLLRAGQLVRYSRRVLVDRWRTGDLTTRAAAALLQVGADATLTSHTAALLFGCTAADAGVIHVLSRYDRRVRARPGLFLHQTFFAEDDVLELSGLRTLCLEAVITEMLCTAHRPLALACADQALAALAPDFREPFRTEVESRLVARRDRRGTRRARLLVELATGLPESPAESQVLLAVVDAGLPVPIPQVPILDLNGRERYRLDFGWTGPKIALEYDGFEAHEGRELADARREADLRSRGWLVVRAGARDLRDSRRMIAEVRAAFARRRFVA